MPHLRVTHRYIVISVFVVLVLFTSSFYLKDWWNGAYSALRYHGRKHDVRLIEDGFSPPKITISKGDTVRFFTRRGELFWPASDLHPTHTLYAEFDPQRPLSPDDGWSFRFDKPGTWRYHDHLAPLYRGTVLVVDPLLPAALWGKESLPEPRSSATCDNIGKDSSQASSQKLKCFEEYLVYILKVQSLEAALIEVKRLYDTEPQFAGKCHELLHQLGAEAYALFAGGHALALSTNTSYCGYGFYHGFMEALLQKGKDFREAQRFCKRAGEELALKTRDAEGACYHGIGHGATDSYESRRWRDEEDFSREALKLCDLVSPNETLLMRCASGVFNSMAIAYNQGKLAIRKEDPFWFCKTQQKHPRKRACVQEMNTALLTLTRGDFAKSAKFVESMGDPLYAVFAMEGLAGYHAFLYPAESSYAEVILTCRALRGELRLPCLRGFAAGLVEHGSPGREFVRGLSFCQSKGFSAAEEEDCMRHLLFYFSAIYPKEKLAAICAKLAEKYHKFCAP